MPDPIFPKKRISVAGPTVANMDGIFIPPSATRPYYVDDQGGKRSEYKTTVQVGEQTHAVLPTVIDGQQLSVDDAVNHYANTGEHMGTYATGEEAERASKLRTFMYNNLPSYQAPTYMAPTQQQYPHGGPHSTRITHDPNDPGIQAYADSLSAYQNDIAWDKAVAQLPVDAPSAQVSRMRQNIDAQYPLNNVQPSYVLRDQNDPALNSRVLYQSAVDPDYRVVNSMDFKHPVQKVVYQPEPKPEPKKKEQAKKETVTKTSVSQKVIQPKDAKSTYTPKQIEENIDDLNLIHKYGEDTKAVFLNKIKPLLDKGDIDGARKVQQSNFQALEADPKLKAAYGRLEAKGLLPKATINSELGDEFQYATFKRYELPKKEQPQEKPLRKYIRYTPDTPGVGKYFLYDEDRGIKGKPLTEAQVNSNAYIMYPQMKTSYKEKAKKTFEGKEEIEKFNNFVKTLPSNLRYTDTSTYNLKGYWEALGKPKEFDYSQPKEKDGAYHAFSRNPRTGEILKSENHPSFKEAIESDKQSGYMAYRDTNTGKIYTFKRKPKGRNFEPYTYAYGGEIYPTNSALENISVDQIAKGTTDTGELSTFNQLQGLETAQSKLQKQNNMNNMTPEMLAAYQQMMAQQQAYGGPMQYNVGGKILAGGIGALKGGSVLLPGPFGGMARQGLDVAHNALDKNIDDSEAAIGGGAQLLGAAAGTFINPTAAPQAIAVGAEGATDVLKHGTGKWGKENAATIDTVGNLAGQFGSMAAGDVGGAAKGGAAGATDQLSKMADQASKVAPAGGNPLMDPTQAGAGILENLGSTMVPGSGLAVGIPGQSFAAYGGPLQANNNYQYMTYANGGPIKANGGLAEIDAGGMHEENPLGGVPQGPDALVEEGEAVMDTSQPGDDDISKFVFSDRIKRNKDRGKGKETFADAAKKIKKKHGAHKDGDRFGDKAAERAMEAELTALADEQEAAKAEEIARLESKIQELGGQTASAQMPQGMPQDMAMQGMPQGMPPEMGMPQGMPPGMEQGMPGGMPPEAAGAMPPGMDPSMMGQDPMMAPQGMAAYGGKIMYGNGGDTDKENPYNFESPTERNLKIGLGQAANSAGDIYNLVQGLRGTDPIHLDRFDADTINLAAQRQQIERDNALADAMMRKNLRSNNAASYYSNLVAGTAANQKARGDARAKSYLEEELKNTEIMNKERMTNLEIAQKELEANMQADMKAKEAVQQGLHGIGASAATGMKDIRQSEAQDRFMKMAAANMESEDFKMDPATWAILYKGAMGK